jgi:hypothetical protein
MSETYDEMKERHIRERNEFIANCHHTEILVEDNEPGYQQRQITLRCARCRLNLMTWNIEGEHSYLSYVRDCVNGHPDCRQKMVPVKEGNGRN